MCIRDRVSSFELASAAVELDVDGLVVQGAEAGGHARSTTPLLTLLGGMRERYPDLLLLAAGGIANGERAAAALRAGADGVWVGSRLVASEEAHAHPEYKRRLVESGGETVVTTAFGPEWPDQAYRVLPSTTVRTWAGREREIPDPPPPPAVIGRTRLFPHSVNAPYDMPKFSAVVPTPDTSGDWEEMAFPAGGGAGLIGDVKPAGQIVEEMMSEAGALLAGTAAT